MFRDDFEEALDGIDASVFSGDLLYDDTLRNLLKEHVERWSRAIREHERFQVTFQGSLLDHSQVVE